MDLIRRLTLRLHALTVLFVALALCLFAGPAFADGGVDLVPLATSILSKIPADVLIGVLGTVLCATLVPLVFKHLKRADQDRVLAVTKGLYGVVAAIAKVTPTPLDDLLAALVQKVADEMGRDLSPAEVQRVTNIALAMHADPTKPDLGTPTAAELARHINIPRA